MNVHKRISLRSARETDLQSLQSIHADSVRGVGPIAYSQGQVDVWSAFASEVDSPISFLVNTYLAVTDDQVVGFWGIADDGHVASIYVRPDWCGQGIGITLLSEVLILHPKPTSGGYYAETSIFSLPLFERRRFSEREG